MNDIVKIAETIFGVKSTPTTIFDREVLRYMQKGNLTLLLVKKRSNE